MTKYRAAELCRSSGSIPVRIGGLYDLLMAETKARSDVAAFIKAARKKMGLTLEAFGDLFSRSKANVHGWERGLHEPPFAVLAAISKAAEIPLPNSTHQEVGQPTQDGHKEQPLVPFLTADLWSRLTKEQRVVVAWEASKVAKELLESVEKVRPMVAPRKQQANAK